jgi:hypothetical protein
MLEWESDGVTDTQLLSFSPFNIFIGHSYYAKASHRMCTLSNFPGIKTSLSKFVGGGLS